MASSPTPSVPQGFLLKATADGRLDDDTFSKLDCSECCRAGGGLIRAGSQSDFCSTPLRRHIPMSIYGALSPTTVAPSMLDKTFVTKGVLSQCLSHHH